MPKFYLHQVPHGYFDSYNTNYQCAKLNLSQLLCSSKQNEITELLYENGISNDAQLKTYL